MNTNEAINQGLSIQGEKPTVDQLKALLKAAKKDEQMQRSFKRKAVTDAFNRQFKSLSAYSRLIVNGVNELKEKGESECIVFNAFIDYILARQNKTGVLLRPEQMTKKTIVSTLRTIDERRKDSYSERVQLFSEGKLEKAPILRLNLVDSEGKAKRSFNPSAILLVIDELTRGK